MSTTTGPHPLELLPERIEVRALEGWFDQLFTTGEEAPRFRLELATHELCMNVIEHGRLQEGQRILLDGRRLPEKVVVDVSDRGGVLPDAVLEVLLERGPDAPATRITGAHGLSARADDDTAGGYGLLIVRRLVDELGHRRVDGRTVVTLAVAIGAVTSPSAPAAGPGRTAAHG